MEQHNSKPIIDTTVEVGLERQSGLAWNEILRCNNPPWCFLFNNKMCWLVTGNDGIHTIAEMDPYDVIFVLARIITWIGLVRGKRQEIEPPFSVAKDILATPTKYLPHLLRFTTIPTYSSSGRLIFQPGYDAETKTFYSPTPEIAALPISSNPTASDVETARAILYDLIADFPFVDPASRAHVFAAMIQPFIRSEIPGPTPIHFILKPTPGAGGTLLAEIVCLPSCGRGVPLIPQSRDETECARMVLSFLRTGSSAMVIDNVDGELNSPTMNMVLTGENFTGRLIGSSDMAKVAITCMFIATGNNPSFGRETSRRVVPIRLDAGVEGPELRTGFRHRDLKSYASEHRPMLVWAILTLCQHWHAVGCPKKNVDFGSFVGYADVMGGLLESVGVCGFLENVEILAELPSADETFRAFIEAWKGSFGSKTVTAADLVHLAEAVGLGDSDDGLTTRQLGEMLNRRRNMVFGQVRLMRRERYNGVRHWSLEPLAEKAGA